MTTHEGFTPGPWEADHTGHIGKPGLGIARLLRARGEKGSPLNRTDAANARLIADAPRLYAENQRLAGLAWRVVAGVLQGMTFAGDETFANDVRALAEATKESGPRAALNGED